MPQVGNFYSHLFYTFSYSPVKCRVICLLAFHCTVPNPPPSPPPPQALSGFSEKVWWKGLANSPSQTEKQNKNSTLFVACDGAFSFSILQRNSWGYLRCLKLKIYWCLVILYNYCACAVDLLECWLSVGGSELSDVRWDNDFVKLSLLFFCLLIVNF